MLLIENWRQEAKSCRFKIEEKCSYGTTKPNCNPVNCLKEDENKLKVQLTCELCLSFQKCTKTKVVCSDFV